MCLLSFAFPSLGAQSFGRGAMPGVQSVAIVGQINLAHQPPSVSHFLMLPVLQLIKTYSMRISKRLVFFKRIFSIDAMEINKLSFNIILLIFCLHASSVATLLGKHIVFFVLIVF